MAMVSWVFILDRVDSEGEGHNGHSARPDDHGLHVEPHEGQEAPECLHDVSVISARLPDHAAQLCVAVGAHHREDARGEPHRQSHPHGASVLGIRANYNSSNIDVSSICDAGTQPCPVCFISLMFWRIEINAIQQENWMRIIPRDVKRGVRESVIRENRVRGN